MANLRIRTFIICVIAKVAALAMLFSPRVVYFIVITIIFCIAGGIGIAVYVFKRYINVKITAPCKIYLLVDYGQFLILSIKFKFQAIK